MMLKKGFTLIELLVTIAILAAALGAIGVAMMASIQGVINAKESTAGIGLCEEEIEAIRNCNAFDMQEAIGTGTLEITFGPPPYQIGSPTFPPVLYPNFGNNTPEGRGYIGSQTVIVLKEPATRTVTLFWIDDPVDGIAAADANGINDILGTRVSVRWIGLRGYERIREMEARFAIVPKQ